MIVQKPCLTSTRLICRTRRGFTLLEMLLALALAVVVVTAIAGATSLYLGTVTKQQRRIETAEVARSVMTMLHNDIRAALQYKPDDYSGLGNLAASQDLISGIAAASGNEPADGAAGEGDGTDIGETAVGEGDTGAAAGAAGGQDEPAPEEEEEQEDPEDCVSCRPTFIGTRTQINIDISRLPRLDEYDPATGSDAGVQLPNDVKAVAFFVSQQAAPADQQLYLPLSKTRNGGLYRRQIDRAKASFRGEQGLVVSVDEFSELIAPEVVGIEFRYWDGENWQAQWDSEVDNGFPSAIEVWMEIDIYATVPRSSNEIGTQAPATLTRHKTVIHLPAAEIIEEDE